MRTSDALYTHEDSQKKPPETKRTLDELPKATRDKLIQVANDSFPVENSDDDSSDDDSSDGETRAVSKEQKAIAKQKREVAIQNKIKQLLSRLNEPDAVPTTETNTNTKYISQMYTAVSLSEEGASFLTNTFNHSDSSINTKASTNSSGDQEQSSKSHEEQEYDAENERIHSHTINFAEFLQSTADAIDAYSTKDSKKRSEFLEYISDQWKVEPPTIESSK